MPRYIGIDEPDMPEPIELTVAEQLFVTMSKARLVGTLVRSGTSPDSDNRTDYYSISDGNISFLVPTTYGKKIAAYALDPNEGAIAIALYSGVQPQPLYPRS